MCGDSIRIPVCDLLKPVFGYSVSLRIQSEYWKIQTRKIPNTDTFHAVLLNNEKGTLAIVATQPFCSMPILLEKT